MLLLSLQVRDVLQNYDQYRAAVAEMVRRAQSFITPTSDPLTQHAMSRRNETSPAALSFSLPRRGD